METVLRSKNSVVTIGPGKPFVIIGERINPTGRKKLGEEMAAGNFDRVAADALAQVQAGAHMLDVNSGVPGADEPAIMRRAVQLVQGVVDVPLSIDSSRIDALKAGLETYEGKALVNSVTGEEDRLAAILPLVKQHGAVVVAIAHDEQGISPDPTIRFEVAQKIINRAETLGIPREDVLIDPLVLPLSTTPTTGSAVFEMLARLREELGVNTVCGASNVSFGLPNRGRINAAFIAMLIAQGMPCAITNPLEEDILESILAADALMGRDEYCMRWIKHFRAKSAQQAG